MLINTYGELLAEIDRVEDSILKIRQGMGYEYGDDFDLKLYLIELKRTKKYNEKLNELRLSNFCYECNSQNVTVKKYRDIEQLLEMFEFKCGDCGVIRTVGLTTNDLMELWDIKKGNLGWLE